jgi:hypothetical protein
MRGSRSVSPWGRVMGFSVGLMSTKEISSRRRRAASWVILFLAGSDPWFAPLLIGLSYSSVRKLNVGRCPVCLFG